MCSLNLVIKFLYLPDLISYSNDFKSHNSIITGWRIHTRNILVLSTLTYPITFKTFCSIDKRYQIQFLTLQVSSLHRQFLALLSTKVYPGRTLHAHHFSKREKNWVDAINESKQTLQVLASHQQADHLFNNLIVLLHQNCWKLRAPLLGGTGLQPRISRCVYGGGTTEVHRTGDFFASRSYQGIT